MSAETGRDTSGPYSVLLPPGWVRLPVDERIDVTLETILGEVVQRAPAERRPALRRMLEESVRSAIDAARGRGAIDVIMSFAEVGGLPVPASIVCFPVDPPEGSGKPEEMLVGLARPGSRAVEIDGLPAIRRPLDVRGDGVRPAHRALNYIVHVPWQRRWLLFTASILTSEEPGFDVVLESLEALMDAMVSTVRFTREDDA